MSCPGVSQSALKDGAVEKTRTSTAFRPQRPQRCASTSSATTARAWDVWRYRYRPGRRASSKALRVAQRRSLRPKAGQTLNRLFTIARRRRYTVYMLLLLAAASVVVQAGPQAHPDPNYHSGGHRPGSLTAEATATVRILSGARIAAASGLVDAHIQTVHLTTNDGQTRIARLVEFE